jgi:DNA replication protein DnaC
MMGAVGTGKTHLALALGVEAYQKGLGIQFYRAADLVAVLQEKFGMGMLSRFRARLHKVELLILVTKLMEMIITVRFL